MSSILSIEMSTILITVIGVLGAILCLVYLIVIILAHTPRKIVSPERTYKTCECESLPLIESKSSNPSLMVSVIIPCYNETERLRIMLDEAVPHLESQYANDWEILIVDDGSKDGTAQFALDWVRNYNLQKGSSKSAIAADRVRVCVLVKNRGKGGAVTHGMRFFRGQYAIFVDADGASRFSDLDKLLQAIKTSPNPEKAIAIGSRAHMVNTSAVVKRSMVRNFLMHGLHALVYVFGIRDIADTQCGFKLLSRKAALEIFPNMRTERWIFDVEVLIRGRRKGIPVLEVPISWHEVGGSKLDLATDSVLMAVDLVIMRLAFFLGIYKDNIKTKSD
ncbi:nucleotide-diphospho-sugar transferase [Nadsonia fulvescens var. elongata DSM 6958]|uniref:dolichyl-phosphate beta-glucosyltransferase n=1 Tax=Nadsonia fulvescens var. elongata DSM 6958 TaxID=857566 RepID=A0A1E3PGI0_9ASCO|nr:nucleotide-diphospho-sugar transferase [Nadsonia fulvescens var. elongata DSM 6958]